MLRRSQLTRFQGVPALSKAGFKFQMPWVAAWGDMDAFGHVNNVMYFRYFETARVNYFLATGIAMDDPAQAQKTASTVGVERPILASIACKFRRPITFPDDLILACRTSKIEGDGRKFVLTHAVYSTKLDLIAAIGDGVIVPYDYTTSTSCKIPESWLKGIRELGEEL